MIKQEAGSHYSQFPVEPQEYVRDIEADFYFFSVFKYLCRYPFKNGAQDLRKARSFCLDSENMASSTMTWLKVQAYNDMLVSYDRGAHDSPCCRIDCADNYSYFAVFLMDADEKLVKWVKANRELLTRAQERLLLKMCPNTRDPSFYDFPSLHAALSNHWRDFANEIAETIEIEYPAYKEL